MKINYIKRIRKNIISIKKILARYPSHDLRLLEFIFIHKFSPHLNNQASSFPLQILS